MDDASVTRVLILAELAVGRAWAEQLRGPRTQVWLGRSAIPAGERPDLIVANAHVPAAAARDEVGVILVGKDQLSDGARPADVLLPANCSAGELCRACQLLAEVVRHRRREREAESLQRELVQAAMTDPLTGLANRRAWDRELARRLADAGPGKRLCLAELDLDQFKAVNDTHGHAAGDRLLQVVARAMQRGLRHDDFVAHLGGDEFGLLLWVPGEAAAAAIVERVRRQAAAASELRAVTASAGFALCWESSPSDEKQALFGAADAALIAAKRAGGERSLSALRLCEQASRPYPPAAMEEP